ncbi:MAG TPA: YbgC/FadM family acyl-CoA thioesterase [Thermodesulfovibrionales bacterium]|nr:YbgC/FadM family acyl-CoA thioesterase [Thermodesulfovibrionales bacterium]
MDEVSFEKRIYYHDTDCGGVVYYANYLKHLEEARTEFFSGRGVDLKKMAENGTFFVVARVEIEYKSPAQYQDILRILTRAEKVRATALRFSQRILKNDVTVVEAKTVLVCVDRNFRPRPLPEEVAESL